MKISLNWLKEYITIDKPDEEIAEILTDIGLEVEGIEYKQAIKGGLEGVVIGQVKSAQQHPNADRLKVCSVEVGHDEPLQIVCGAPNVAEGQKVVVALVGAMLYPDEKGFKIKKSKLRGEVSEGMICAEDEIGLGDNHDGIMVLEENAKVGTAAAEYFKLEKDVIFEIGLTPNRIDAASHYGVARDLHAYLNLYESSALKMPKVNELASSSDIAPVKIIVENNDACPRYSGVTIENVEVKESPDWLKVRLKAIGINPTNNIVDITNFVLYELGQPLHAFDLAKINSKRVVIKAATENEKFITLDGVERTLSDQDLMICNDNEPMCIAGVFGGQKSGVTESTQGIFLESAYFDPVWIRKTSKRHGLNTDASFRYERGADPNMIPMALKRAANLIQSIAGGEIGMNVIDIYPHPIEDNIVELDLETLSRIVGNRIEKSKLKIILESLEIKILDEVKSSWRLKIPAFRVDVTREIDVIEEVLRIYGYNNIVLPDKMMSSMLQESRRSPHKVEDAMANYLASQGYSEVLNNSLSSPDYYSRQDELVHMLNPLSKETEVLRNHMLYEGLESIRYNLNRRNEQLQLFEFGKIYRKSSEENFEEFKRMSLWICGNQHEEGWQHKPKAKDFYTLKNIVINCLHRLGISRWKVAELKSDEYTYGLHLSLGKQSLVQFGEISATELRKFAIKTQVYYAEFNWDAIEEYTKTTKTVYEAVSKFPEVRRDLALLVEKNVPFEAIHKIAKRIEQKILKNVNLFDVYEGKNLAAGKKSYGVSFTFQDNSKTLTDQHIDKIMDRLIKALKSELNAELR
ncbi:MAG: phenylalanine--tRNA ligase subunit beta [Verrucomicrobia bacterium]|nr:phenylalanine--tRNA ligase subunit beta [Verrucomicrobiota bacterium]